MSCPMTWNATSPRGTPNPHNYGRDGDTVTSEDHA